LSEASTTNLVVVQERPFNAEAPISSLSAGITPTPNFYVRSNFDVPAIDASSWKLTVGGAVSSSASYGMDALRRMPSADTTCTVECAGNARTTMVPLPSGTPWGLGAISTGNFRGVPLRVLLEAAGVAEDAVEVLFRGSDGGEISPGRTISFERSLPLSEAMRDDVIVAYEMNGEALTAPHGHPARLVVPGYYGVAWVKWLNAIEVLREPFQGHFQVERYVYRNDPDMPQDEPVRRMRVRALITSPLDGATIGSSAPIALSGIAWSGEGIVTRVEVSDDGGTTWNDAALAEGGVTGMAVAWSYEWTPRARGTATLLARATDATGASQPLVPVQNTLGYGNNAVQQVKVTAIG
jgi:DMSO/TMAO reductase YedYZ molybdopterin-dependent catalytic subunit